MHRLFRSGRNNSGSAGVLACPRLPLPIRRGFEAYRWQSNAKAMAQISSLGLNTDFVQVVQKAPTGTAQVTLDESGNATFQIERPAAFDVLQVNSLLVQRCQTTLPDWIYFGTLANTHPANEDLLNRLVVQLQPLKSSKMTLFSPETSRLRLTTSLPSCRRKEACHRRQPVEEPLAHSAAFRQSACRCARR